MCTTSQLGSGDDLLTGPHSLLNVSCEDFPVSIGLFNATPGSGWHGRGGDAEYAE